MKNTHIKLRLSSSTLLYALCIMIPIIQIINSVFLFSDGESSFGKVVSDSPCYWYPLLL